MERQEREGLTAGKGERDKWSEGVNSGEEVWGKEVKKDGQPR